MILAAGILLCFASGFLLARLGWSLKTPLLACLILQCSLATGFSLGIFSVAYFISCVAGVQNLLLVDFGVFLALLILYFFLRSRSTIVLAPASVNNDAPPWLRHTLALSFVVAFAAALYSAITHVLAYPHGDGWDAFSIWNLRARFLFRSGSHWRDAFSPLIPWSHPDYPLLIPASIAHFWTLIGHDDPRVPAAIAFVFTFATAGLLFSALSILRGRIYAMLGAITLLATPAFIEQGTAQYADVPLSFFFLSTIALLCLNEEIASATEKSGRLAALAGLAAAFSAWTKNEGLLFLAAILASRIFLGAIHRKRNSDSRAADQFWRSSAFFAGALPVLFVLLYFKHSVAGPGDLFADSSTTIDKLLTPARYWAVLQWFVKDFFRFGRWLLIPGSLLLAGLYFAVRNDSQRARSLAVRSSVLALILTLAGYAAIYLITPRDLYWHLRFSSDRLFLQLWPSAIFLFFFVLRR